MKRAENIEIEGPGKRGGIPVFYGEVDGKLTELHLRDEDTTYDEMVANGYEEVECTLPGDDYELWIEK